MRSPPEHRGLKAAGMVAVALAAAVAAWAVQHVGDWPIASDRVARLAIAAVVGTNLFALGLLALAAGCGLRPGWRTPRQRRALALQLLLPNVLLPVALYGLLTSDPAVEQSFAATGWDTPLAAATFIACVLAWRMWQRSQRYVAPDAAAVMARDPRPPVLYLRSFKDDGSPLLDEGGTIGRRVYRALAPRSPEQELTDILAHLGPVVAIGKPGEPLPELGAARLYVSDDEWQARVAHLMTEAALVVIRVGSSAGVLWEIEQALHRVPRSKLVLTLQGSGSVAPELAARLAPVLGTAMAAAWPQTAPRGWSSWLWRDPRRPVGAILCFPSGAGPHVVAITNWPPWGRDALTALNFRPSALPLRRAWRQVFARLGLNAGGMDARSRVVAVLLAGLFGAFGAHWFYLGDTRRGWKYVALLPLALTSVYLSWYDAFRFIWVDRATFDGRFARVTAVASATVPVEDRLAVERAP